MKLNWQKAEQGIIVDDGSSYLAAMAQLTSFVGGITEENNLEISEWLQRGWHKESVQFPAFLQAVYEQFLLNWVSRGEPNHAFWWETRRYSREEEEEESFSFLIHNWQKEHWYQNTHVLSPIIHGYILNILKTKYTSAHTHTVNVYWFEKETFGQTPLFWIFMSTCLLPNTHEIISTALPKTCICASLRLCTCVCMCICLDFCRGRRDHLNLNRWDSYFKRGITVWEI